MSRITLEPMIELVQSWAMAAGAVQIMTGAETVNATLLKTETL